MTHRYDLRGRRCVLYDSDNLLSAGLNVHETDLARTQPVDHTVPSVPVTSEMDLINTSSTTATYSVSAAQPNARSLRYS